MITLKTGVPGAGKTLSAVAELLALSKLPEPRAVYTNITGLAIPHIPLTDCTKWRDCPAGSLVVIDEAFLHGYDAKSASAVVPDYIRDLAVHRKDYSLDFIFIAQHPKLLHVALRRQVGKHQHYRRLFGWGRAVCYEWDQAQDNLAATKTAVMTQFSYPKDVFKAYKSAELHTKPAFKKPWYIWLPLIIVPAAVWAFPAALQTLGGAMTGKGIPTTLKPPAVAASAPVPTASAAQAPAVPASGLAVVGVQALDLAALVKAPPPLSGCIATPKRCACLDTTGAFVDTPVEVCEVKAGKGRGPAVDVGPDTVSPANLATAGADLDALRWMASNRPSLAAKRY